MAASVLLACSLNESQLPPFTFIREETDMDASFLVTCILGQRSKVQSTATVLLCLHHTFQHYAGAAARLGFNLQAAREKGALHVIEPLADALSQHEQLLNTAPEDLLANLWTAVRNAVTSVLQDNTLRRTSCTIVLDDVTTLIDLGVPESAVLPFCRHLVQWANSTATTTRTTIGVHADKAVGRISVVLKVNACNLYEHLVTNLASLADSEVQCNRLRSGNFCEVDGRLECVRYAQPDRRHQAVRKTVLYKVNERNVKIFAPGEVGIRI